MRLIKILIAFFLSCHQLAAQDPIVVELVRNINQVSVGNGDGNSFPSVFTVQQDKLYFRARTLQNDWNLFVYDGTADSLTRLTYTSYGDFNLGSELLPFNDGIIFSGDNAWNDYEPWFTDGTVEGTNMIRDLYPGSSNNSSYPSYFVEFDGKVYFEADVTLGSEVYVTDLTYDGTQMLRNIGQISANPMDFMVFNDRLYFRAEESNVVGVELWSTDGTEAGTTMLIDLNSGSGGSSPSNLFVYDNQLYFTAVGVGIGRELWRTDGSASGTELFADINEAESEGSNPRGFIEFDNKLFFVASDSVHGSELWYADADSVHMVKDVGLDIGGLGYAQLHEFDGKLFFAAQTQNFGSRILFESDGTEEGTLPVLTAEGGFIKDPNNFVNWGDRMIFNAKKAQTENTQMWIRNAGSQNARQLFPDSVVGWAAFPYSEHCIYNNELYFAGTLIDSIGVELFKLRDTTQIVTELSENFEVAARTTVFPNPNDGQFIISSHYPEGKHELMVHSMQGVLVYRAVSSISTDWIDLRGLAKGMYFLSVYINEGLSIQPVKFMVE